MQSSLVPILLGLGALVFLILVVLVIRKMASGQIHAGEERKQLEPDEEALAREALGEGPKAEQLPSGPPPPAQLEAPKVAGPSPMARGLAKTKQGFMARVNALLFGGRALDPSLVDELEEVLVTSDIGIQTTQRLLEDLRQRLERKELADPESVRKKLKEQIEAIVGLPCPPLPEKKPLVIMVIGVNGVGKTTTIGKLASRFGKEGKKVVLAAGDTFRAAAVEQLEIWANRSGAELVKGPPESDPASVAFEAVQRAQGAKADIAIADTAGRLHTKVNLMEELKKVRRVMAKALPDAPHEVILVLDATTGQNAIAQAREFTQAVQVSSIALTKLDGTAKGGVVVAICDALKLPVRYVGIGESVEDLRDFDPHEFTEALFARDDEAAAR